MASSISMSAALPEDHPADFIDEARRLFRHQRPPFVIGKKNAGRRKVILATSKGKLPANRSEALITTRAWNDKMVYFTLDLNGHRYIIKCAKHGRYYHAWLGAGGYRTEPIAYSMSRKLANKVGHSKSIHQPLLEPDQNKHTNMQNGKCSRSSPNFFIDDANSTDVSPQNPQYSAPGRNSDPNLSMTRGLRSLPLSDDDITIHASSSPHSPSSERGSDAYRKPVIAPEAANSFPRNKARSASIPNSEVSQPETASTRGLESRSSVRFPARRVVKARGRMESLRRARAITVKNKSDDRVGRSRISVRIPVGRAENSLLPTSNSPVHREGHGRTQVPALVQQTTFSTAPDHTLEIHKQCNTTLWIHHSHSVNYTPLKLRSCMTAATFFHNILKASGGTGRETGQGNIVDALKVTYEWKRDGSVDKNIIVQQPLPDSFQIFLETVNHSPCWSDGIGKCAVTIDLVLP